MIMCFDMNVIGAFVGGVIFTILAGLTYMKLRLDI